MFMCYSGLLCREQVNELKIDFIVNLGCNFCVFMGAHMSI